MCPFPSAQLVRYGERKDTRGIAIVVASGKGGVGKTNLALNLGIQLSRRGQRVTFMDADFGLANADILLDIAPIADVSDALNTERPTEDLLVNGPGGLRVLCGVSGASRNPSASRFGQRECLRALQRLQRQCDTVIVDCGSGLNPTIAALALASDLLMLTTTPEPTALADSYAMLKLLCLSGFAGRTGVVINMARSRREAQRTASRLARVARDFLGLSVEALGTVPFDRHVPQAVRARIPLAVRHPHCAASVAVDEICERLTPPVPTRTSAGDIWTHVASLFL